ncbi:MAG TPA: creatininase family protein [Jiangellaceae bacterium]|nr:creatininase family protein [Jiangellaceae bacterium]
MTVLARLTWPAAEEALAAAKLALLPVGSLEQHGPHLALDTDLAVADALAQRLEQDLGDGGLLCPAVPYGLSEHHLGFPGTVTLRPDTLASLVLDVVESLVHWGLRRVLVVNGHGGNIDALRLVSRRARRDSGALVAAVMWAQLAADEIGARVTSPAYGHACEIETSVVQVLAPDRLFRDRITAPSGRRTVDPSTDPPRAIVDQAVWMDEWTSDGALGDPRLASAELGHAVVDVAYRRAVEFARRFAAAPVPEQRR